MGVDTLKVMALVLMLYKLKLAGINKRSIPLTSQMIKDQHRIGKYVFRLAMVSTSIDYIVAVPYSQHDQNLLPMGI
jgi:hypothetical protein